MLTLLAPTALAKDEDEDPRMILNLSYDYVEVEDLLRVMSRACRQPMVWDPADRSIRGKRITSSLNVIMPRSALWPTMRSLLMMRELVLVPVGPTGHEVWLVLDMRETGMIVKPKPKILQLTKENHFLYEDQAGLYASALIRVEHLEDYTAARTALGRVITGQNIGSVVEIPAAKAFLVTDFAPKVVRCYRLLKEMDQPTPKPSTTKGRTVAISLEHAQAAALAKTLSAHYPDQRITAIGRTNQLLLTGTDEQVHVLRKAARLLDVKVRRPQVRTHVLRLKHAAAGKTAAAVQGLVVGSPALWSKTAPPTIVAYEASLLVAATKADFARILGLVQDLDRAR